MIMVVRKILNNKGQAVFETMMFLPVLLFFVVYMIKSGNAINASINQQKSTRGYTYYLLKGNSKAFRITDLAIFTNMQEVGAYMVGFRQAEEDGASSVAPCFMVPKLPWIPSSSETCSEIGSVTPSESSYIRVFTLYGVCGEAYSRGQGGGDFFTTEYPGQVNITTRKCLFQ